MKKFVSIWVILVTWVLACPLASHGEEGLVNDLELQKQRFRSQYARTIPKDINDLLHKVSKSEAFNTFGSIFTRVTPYLPTTTKALVRNNPQDSTHSIAGLDPGHPGFLTNPVDLATLVTPMTLTLRWGFTPSDLDSHLTGPGFHVYYAASGSATSFPYAWLDIDDVTSFGPETIRIEQFLGSTYRYSVHDFTNRNSSTSSALSNSGATVTFNNALGEVRRFDITPAQTGTLWTVLTLDGSTGRVTPVDTVTNHSTPSTIP